MKRLWSAIFIAWSAACAGPVFAQVAPSVWPRCIAERDGQQIGVGGSMCVCRHEEGGTMLRRPAGWRWSCDIMQMDGSDSVPPAGSAAGVQVLPPGFVYAPQGGAASPALQEPRGPVALFDGGRRR